MWHQATFRGEELLVLGHDPRRNDCMLVRLSGLPMNEQSELRKIAASRAAQESTHLIPILQHQQSPYGSDWFTYLCRKMEQRNAPVFTLPIKEIQDTIDPDQKAIFKGYGKGRYNSSLEREDLARAQMGEGEEDYDFIPNGRVGQPSNLDNKLDQLRDTIADESRLTQKMLGELIKVLAPAKKTAKPRRASKKDHVEIPIECEQ